ncbi:MAG: COX15/CtaA family protein [Xanthomonadales bacterium]|nr:COX15/CtaA family protein [Xanthomonadales bacterium]
MTVYLKQIKHNRQVAAWLLICCALVFLMVVLGGATRLTGSGLSIVDWKPIMGVLPPTSEQAWSDKFELYQQSPQYHKVNKHFDVAAFKEIFWLEYYHRLLGRALGVVFLLPFLFFLATGRIKKQEFPKYGLMFLLGGFQGLLGWYMVKSGLVNNPSVSQYRLAAHLISAFIIYAYMFWVAMSLLFHATDGHRDRLYNKSLWLTGLITITVISGAFVAGLKAGFVFNTFPKMDGQWIHKDLLSMQPLWRNFTESLLTVQFDHRVLATLTLLIISAFWLYARNRGMPPRARPALHLLMLAVLVQFSLGIATLLMFVPTTLGVLHQGMAMVLFTIAIYYNHALRGTRVW